jgi:hypothetical protein
MPRTPAESAEELMRRKNDRVAETLRHNNEKTTRQVEGMSPNSRASLRLQRGNSTGGKSPKENGSKKNTPTKDGGERVRNNSQGGRRRHGNTKSPQTNNESSSGQNDGDSVLPEVETSEDLLTKALSTANKATTGINKPRRYPDYSGCVVTYTCPKTNRNGHGIVGVCNHELGTYELQLTFSDNKEPSGHTESSVPLELVEENMVDDDTARAWTEAVARHLLIDSPGSKAQPLRESRSSSSARKKKHPKIPETQNDAEEELTPSKKGTKRKRKSSVLLDPGIEAMVLHHVREAMYDIRPSEARSKPFMYWNPSKETACAKMLIKRTPALRVMADSYRRNEFARLISGAARGAGNNERSAQVRQIKLIYLDGKSDFALVTDYVIGASANGALKQMRISNALSGEFNDIEDLRNALYSPSMYTYENLFDLFCAALESGRFRATNQMPISPIENLITVAHEAHFRLELWYALTAQSFRHDTARIACEERAEKHHNLCLLVAQDRRENGTLAFNNRNCTHATNDDDSDHSDDSDGGVDSQFY